MRVRIKLVTWVLSVAWRGAKKARLLGEQPSELQKH